MSEEQLLKYYGCNSLSEFIDTYLDCETSFDLLRTQFKEIERLNNIINELAFIFDDYNEFNEILEKYNYELKGSDKE